jgi:protein-S-isoprenylcysteine O-methyltransferase Ste14
MTGSKDTPHIVILPPVLVAGGLLLGIAIHYTVWTVTLLPIIVARPLGLTVFVSAGVLAHLAQLALKRVGTNLSPTKPTLALATDGPYRFTRNPLYVAALGVYLGVTLWVDGLAPLLLLFPVAWMLHWGIVLREEHYLQAKFGATYDAYRLQVRRWA